MSTYDYVLQGVSLTDTRWASIPGAPIEGVWHMRSGTSTLPHFPGLRATRFNRLGQHGESQAQFAPIQPRTLELNMRFLAVATNPAHPRFQQWGRTFDERMAFLEENINEFFFRTMIGQTSGKGYLNLTRRNNQFEHFPAGGIAAPATNGDQHTAGRFLASSAGQMDDDARWADYTLLFEIPQGTWWTDTQYRAASVPAGASTAIEIPMGTAPVWDAKIAFHTGGAGPGSNEIKFTNDQGVGFSIGRSLTSDDSGWWRVVDAGERSYGGHRDNNGAEPNWDVEMDNPTIVHEIGRPQGSALMIHPGVSGTSRRVGRVFVKSTVPLEVRIAYRPRWF